MADPFGEVLTTLVIPDFEGNDVICLKFKRDIDATVNSKTYADSSDITLVFS